MSVKSLKSKCFSTFDLNESTCKFVKKCDPGKVRNKDFRCVVRQKTNLTEFLEDIKNRIDKLNEGKPGSEEKKKRGALRGALTKALTKEKSKSGLTGEQIDEIKEAIEYAKLPSSNSAEKQQLKAEQTAQKKANKTAQKEAKLAELATRVAERRREAENTQNKPTKTKKTLKDRKAAATRKRSSSSGSSGSSIVSAIKKTINSLSGSNRGARSSGSSSSLRSLSQETQSK